MGLKPLNILARKWEYYQQSQVDSTYSVGYLATVSSLTECIHCQSHTIVKYIEVCYLTWSWSRQFACWNCLQEPESFVKLSGTKLNLRCWRSLIFDHISSWILVSEDFKKKINAQEYSLGFCSRSKTLWNCCDSLLATFHSTVYHKSSLYVDRMLQN